LKTGQGNLIGRIALASRIDSDDRGVLAWMTSILVIQQGKENANSWLKKQLHLSPSSLSYIQDILARLSNEMIEPHSSQIIGGVKQISIVDRNDWIAIDSKPDWSITNEQVWYEVDVSAFNDGQIWLKSPFTDIEMPQAQLREFFTEMLGITADRTIQLIVWLADGEQEVTPANIKAVHLKQGNLQLLVAGSRINASQDNLHKPLALTDTTLEWVQPSPITISQLYQENPHWLAAALPNVWHCLQKSGDISPGSVPSFPHMEEKMQDWPVQSINLTDPDQPSLVMTISGSAIADLQQSGSQPLTQSLTKEQDLSHPRSLIISSNGQTIYSDFVKNSPRELIAVAKLANSSELALLVDNAGRYELERWSEANQRFE
jgi:hypothetical protein